jgi:hypothetical protein
VAMPLITRGDTATRLGVTYDRAAELVRTGLLPPGVVVRLGRQIRVNPEALDEFLAAGGQALPGGWRQEAEGELPGSAPASSSRIIERAHTRRGRVGARAAHR